ncbi:MAG: hypothetical protein A2148_07620 [Chloroflexi bacterium RBG_16_68_14]|nr:MAG: hypothetical protein A2148_07620 [Chloroflexi bacterium RBG_16_68_14]
MEPQIQFCTSADGTRIAYVTLGEGRPLVHVQLWSSNLELFWADPAVRRWLERMAEGRRYVSFDRRGVGGSQREVGDFSLEAHAADVAAVVDHLHLERFDMFASVDGAAVAVAYAAQHPERVSRLVLWAPYPRGQDFFRSEAIQGLLELVRGNWSLARRAIADVVFPSGPTEAQRWLADLLRQTASPEVAARGIEFHSSVDVTALLPQVKAPTLVLHRRGDRNVPIRAGRDVASLIPDARFVALEGDIAGTTHGDTSYVELVMRFLDEGRDQGQKAEPSDEGAFRTILFTDVEESTALTQRLGDAKARELLRIQERIVRDALQAHGGSELKTMGDGFMVSFSSATRALECAIAMQQALAEHNQSATEPIQVRIGLNAGEPIAEEKDLFGTAVIVAARIAAQAQGGMILASDVVRQLVAGRGFLFADRGEVGLRGFEEPVRLFEVAWRE